MNAFDTTASYHRLRAVFGAGRLRLVQNMRSACVVLAIFSLLVAQWAPHAGNALSVDKLSHLAASYGLSVEAYQGLICTHASGEDGAGEGNDPHAQHDHCPLCLLSDVSGFLLAPSDFALNHGLKAQSVLNAPVQAVVSKGSVFAEARPRAPPVS